MNGDKESSRAGYYPIFVSLEQKACLVVGGGSVGERKVRTLLQYGADIRMLAQNLTPWLQTQREEGAITYVGEEYSEDRLDGVDLVFATTSDAELNRRIAADSSKRRLWCNMATDPELGSMIVPATLQRGPLTIAISTGGASPALARLLREKLEKQFGTEWTVAIMFMGLLRSAIQSKGQETSLNQNLFREIARLPVAEWIKNNQQNQAIQTLHELCRPWLAFDELNQAWDEAWELYSSSLPPSATALEPLAT